MKAYRICWLVLCGVLGVVGTAMAFTWSLSNVIMLVVLAGITGAVVALVALANPDGPARDSWERRWIVARTTALTAVATVSFIGLGTLLGAPTAVLLLAVAVGGSPFVIRYCVRWLRDRGHLTVPAPKPARPNRDTGSAPLATATIIRPEPDLDTKPPVAPAVLSDEELCTAWRASFSALQKAGSPTQRMRIVDERRAYLDEIELRSVHGMAAWLASGPRAAGDPSRFVLGDGAASRARIDWDDLLHDMEQ
ncbi:hypothetical protein EV645_3890 [Kribbella rubisoli]|uniref:Uncharacterized protein n=1 Tax=Kribbella rubisoli TaxID=3075929 RepID=A0A4Q7X2A8_9ACTN|nr:hypothetical protein [Kribbella rubisoli]RZU16335.1 hypothetical protein EV645_3890 [Kribbella rubisoli]